MKPLFWMIVALVLGPIGWSNAADARPVHRFGLFVGANQGQPSQPRLRWAIADAQKMAAVMIETGGINSADAKVLGQPSAAEVVESLRSMRGLVRDTKAQGQRVEFYFYYSGHSDDRGLLVGGERVLYADLRKAITNTEADVNVAILDSCDSGAFTRAKGGERVQPFLTDLSSETTGYAFLTSSSENEASQESDQLGGSFFTYYLISGLRGAADTGSKRVTLNQAYQYAFRETLAQTEGTSIGAQHASYDFQLKGSGDLVIVDLTNPRSSVLLDGALSGRFYIRDQKGALVSELQKEAGKTLTIAIPSGNYTIRQQQEGVLRTARIVVGQDTQTPVNKELFVSEAAQINRPRGEDPQARALRIFDLQVIPNFETVAEEDTAISLGLIGARVDGVRGTQMSGVASFAEQSNGAQVGGAVAVADTVTGVQFAGAVNVAGDVEGWQLAGAVAIARDVVGVQTAGAVNVAQSVVGIQVGVVNVAKTIRGLQIGVFNYADDAEGVPLGIVSWVTHGIHELTVGYAGGDGTFVRWVGGSRVVWTSLEFGARFSAAPGSGPKTTWFDVGLGYRFEKDGAGLDLGAGLRQLNIEEPDQTAGFFSTGNGRGHLEMVPHLDASVRYNVGERWALWVGPRLDLVDSRLVSLDRYTDSQSTMHLWDIVPGFTSVYLGFATGLTFKF